METLRIQHRDLIVACDLDPALITGRLGAWQDLQSRFGLGSDLIEGGARLWLHPDGAADAVALARSEGACCAFLDIEVEVDGERLRIELTSEASEGAMVARALTGIESP